MRKGEEGRGRKDGENRIEVKERKGTRGGGSGWEWKGKGERWKKKGREKSERREIEQERDKG